MTMADKRSHGPRTINVSAVKPLLVFLLIALGSSLGGFATLMVSIVGIVMVIVMLTLPAAIAGRFVTRMGPMMALAAAIWTGSDDGLVHVTRDHGETWADVTPPGMPAHTRVMNVEVSPHDPATVYLAATRYKLADTRPSLFKTKDYGASWQRIVDEDLDFALVTVFLNDPRETSVGSHIPVFYDAQGRVASTVRLVETVDETVTVVVEVVRAVACLCAGASPIITLQGG